MEIQPKKKRRRPRKYVEITTAGSIVPKAKAGESFHNYGVAYDIYPTKHGEKKSAKCEYVTKKSYMAMCQKMRRWQVGYAILEEETQHWKEVATALGYGGSKLRKTIIKVITKLP